MAKIALNDNGTDYVHHSKILTGKSFNNNNRNNKVQQWNRSHFDSV